MTSGPVAEPPDVVEEGCCSKESKALAGQASSSAHADAAESNGSVGSEKDGYRDYDSFDETSTVTQFYRSNHQKQTYEHVMNMKKKYYTFEQRQHTIMELFEVSDQIVDESDTDTHLSQMHHALQTAERARRLHPQEGMEWFWFTAFIHDLGKVLALYGEPQWSVVGDTFPVGCAFAGENIFPHFFAENSDSTHDTYSTQLGLYSSNCGFDNVHFSFGHDDYLASCLEHNGTALPREALYIIRYVCVHVFNLSFPLPLPLHPPISPTFRRSRLLTSSPHSSLQQLPQLLPVAQARGLRASSQPVRLRDAGAPAGLPEVRPLQQGR